MVEIEIQSNGETELLLNNNFMHVSTVLII